VGRGFSSNGKENKASVVDLKTLHTVSKIDTGESPDALVYDSKHGEAYIFNHRGNSATVFDAKTSKVTATISLGGGPEFAAVDPAADRVYVNIEDKSEVVAIDTRAHQIVSVWPIAPGEGASGMAFDAAHHRLFLGCDNHLMLMLDSNTGKVVGSVPIGAGVDANAFDQQLQLAFSSNGEGTFKELLETLLRNSFTPIEWEGFTPYNQLPPRKPLKVRKETVVDSKILQRYVGRYGVPPDLILVIRREGDHLSIQENDEPKQELYAASETVFFSKLTDDEFTFELDANGRVTQIVLRTDGKEIPIKPIL